MSEQEQIRSELKERQKETKEIIDGFGDRDKFFRTILKNQITIMDAQFEILNNIRDRHEKENNDKHDKR